MLCLKITYGRPTVQTGFVSGSILWLGPELQVSLNLADAIEEAANAKILKYQPLK
jgi:hypothetical protein